jgi:hypothetical protein
MPQLIASASTQGHGEEYRKAEPRAALASLMSCLVVAFNIADLARIYCRCLEAGMAIIVPLPDQSKLSKRLTI